MGASLYYHTTAYTPDATVALELLQSSQLDEYDLPGLVAETLASTQQAFDNTPEDDEYDLHDYYKSELEHIMQIASEPIPSDFYSRLELVRQLDAGTGEGVGNILDVNGIADQNGTEWDSAKPLERDELIARFGTDKLLSTEVDHYASTAFDRLDRGECIFFPLYASVDQDEPTEWCFVAATID